MAFLDKIDPDRRFHGYLPHGPYPVHDDRTSWFDVDRDEPAAEQLRAALDWLDGLPYERERTVLGGWSQGANVAFAVGLSPGSPRPAGVIALGGGFRDELPPDLERPLPPIAICHGRADEAVPVEAARHAREALERAGGDVLYLETDIGHEIDQAVIPDLRRFLAALP